MLLGGGRGSVGILEVRVLVCRGGVVASGGGPSSGRSGWVGDDNVCSVAVGGTDGMHGLEFGWGRGNLYFWRCLVDGC